MKSECNPALASNESAGMLQRIKKMACWSLKSFHWPLLLLPILVALIVARLSSREFFYLSEATLSMLPTEDLCKEMMEIVHPSFLLCATLLALQSWRLTRKYTFGWLSILGTSLFLRELHFAGASTVNYAVLLLLAYNLIRHPERLGELLNSRWALSFLIMTFTCYATMEVLDRGLIKRIGWLILWDQSWRVPYSSNIEESLEALGGLCLLTSMFFIRRDPSPGTE